MKKIRTVRNMVHSFLRYTLIVSCQVNSKYLYSICKYNKMPEQNGV